MPTFQIKLEIMVGLDWIKDDLHTATLTYVLCRRYNYFSNLISVLRFDDVQEIVTAPKCIPPS